MFKRVLVANRGEIARRIIKTLRVLGIEAVAVHSEADRTAPFVQEADFAVDLGASEAAASYLNAEKIIHAAKTTQCEAIHPGYGFLSENAGFAALCENEGIKFIGPSAAAMEKLGNKKEARDVAVAAGVAVVPGGEVGEDNRLARETAKKIGFPVLVKSAGGGGGKGMRRVTHLDDLDEALHAARRESMAAFGTDALILERYVEGARHVEVQILGDRTGHVIPVMERDCTLQRRHQKVVEECPSPKVDGALRKRLLEGAAKLAAQAGYENAGTLEFLLTPQGELYFLEMNVRLQVEHPVTELVCGLDLVAWQLLLASGVRFAEKRLVVEARGHAIEARVYAEDPVAGFLPQSGTLTRVRWPDGPGIRVDAGVVTGSVITTHYDPMLGKVIAYGTDRDQARARLVEALRATLIAGVTTNVPFLIATLNSGRFRNGAYDTTSIERGDFELDPVQDAVPAEVLMLARAALRRKGEERPVAEAKAPEMKPEPEAKKAAPPESKPPEKGAREPKASEAVAAEETAIPGPWDASDSFRIVGGPRHG